jgi:hypothetical protein
VFKGFRIFSQRASRRRRFKPSLKPWIRRLERMFCQKSRRDGAKAALGIPPKRRTLASLGNGLL